MNRDLISKAIGNIDDRHIFEAAGFDPARQGKSPERITPMTEIKTYRRRSKRLTALIIAACLLLSLSIVAYAAGWFGLKEATITDSRLEDAFEDEVYVGQELVPATVVTLSGYEGTKEYQAAKEWQEFYNAYVANDYNGDAFGQYLGEWGEAHRGAYWNIYTPALADQFQRICETYGLAARSGKYEGQDDALYSGLCQLAGISPFLSDSGRRPDGLDYYFLYDDGSFSCHDYWWPHDEFDDYNLAVENIRIFRNRKGFMGEGVLELDPDEELEEWVYTTAGGETVDLVMGEKTALILYDGEYAFVSILWQQLHLQRPSGVDISRESLERYADTIDFAALGSEGNVRFPGTGTSFVAPTPEP